MPTLNSEKTIEKALISVRNQDIDQFLVEILVLDGGSTDKTKLLAKKYGAKIINNKKVQQEYAKSIGLNTASGNYAVFLDSDEEFQNLNSLKSRLNFFQANPEVKNLITSGLITPPGYPRICDYINAFGDPFSYFIYRLNGSEYRKSLPQKYSSQLKEDGVVIRFNEDDILPIVDAGSHTFDLDYLRKNFSDEIKDTGFIPNLFTIMAGSTHSLGVLNNDYILHYSSSTITNYLQKVRWKIIANIHYRDLPGVGFTNKSKLDNKLVTKRYLYILYCVSIILPAFDSIKISLKMKNPTLLLHFVFCYYVLFTTAYYYLLYFLKITPALGAYGKTK